MNSAINKKFNDYLMSCVQVLTDDNPLSRVLISKRSATDISKLAYLSSYNCSTIYRNGKNNGSIVALSRYPMESVSDLDDGIIAMKYRLYP